MVPAVKTSPLDDDEDDDEDLSIQLDDTVRDSLMSELTFEADEVTGSLCDTYLQTRV